MRDAPLRLVNAVFWPLTIWTSLSTLDDHPADDYVERTSPIVASAIGFWICAALLIAATVIGGGSIVNFGDGFSTTAARVTPRWAEASAGVLWFFTPVIYLVGLWLFATRDEAFPR